MQKIQKLYHPRLAMLLMELDHVLHEQGLGLFCVKCHRKGLPDGVRGASTNAEYVLECGCTRRSWQVKSGEGKVVLQ